ncbi:all trans-polyprenyl-diphosphate synthase PDSS2-like [Anopheles ziemanni]|uniref:all trans-polyprenyl-diphosphate synthase PDSS2-like n=1 Tax=Anopheles coustani TaxID=139045 RepID=UPI00265A23F2|nr:all trans-polyprenyl-diphosphate synthase PDSS2-like [Anopheles coustani]XP_058170087.1 all trans-polyprenyl-diphosphate synthase PDSS2-like [Anopheles ziemanni]
MSLSRVYGMQARLRTQLQKSAINVASTSPAPLVLESAAHRRWIASGTVCHEKLAAKPVQKHDWNRAVSEAEKIVGYPTSFLSLRWLLSDEIANVALHLRKLVGSNHPLLRTAKVLIYNGKSNMQAWGLIVLLVSKAVGHAPTIPDLEQDKSAGVLQSQRGLAEITEMIRTAHLVHQGLVNLQPMVNAGNELGNDTDTIFGNKIALLSGDYLLGNACLQLAGLRNQSLIELISSAVRDLTESSFFGERDVQNNALPSRPLERAGSEASVSSGMEVDLSFGDMVDNTQPLSLAGVMGNPEKEWSLRHILGAGSLLGKSCQGTIMLAGQPESLQRQGYMFGKHLSLAWQACIDLEPFSSDQLPPGGRFSLVSAPVLFHLDHEPSLYAEIEKGSESVENIDYAKVHAAVMRGPGLEKTRALQKRHSLAALTVLQEFPSSDARTALQNIIFAMQDI